LFRRFYRRVAVLPYSRKLYNECRDGWENQSDPVKRAVMWFVVARQSFGGIFANSWGFSAVKPEPSSWLSCLESLPEIHARLQRVQIESNDFRRVIETYDNPDTFFYLDPPYVHAIRSAGKYRHEMSDTDHKELIEMLLELKGKALLSGYPNDIYKPLEQAGWHTRRWQTVCYAAGRTRATGILGEGSATKMQPRTECVWANYDLDNIDGEPLLF